MKKSILLVLLLICTTAVCFACTKDGDHVYEKDCEHVYESKVTLQADCVTEGIVTYACAKCAYYYTEPISKTSHDFGEVTVLKEATCSVEGEKGKKCNICNKIEVTEVLSKTDHKYETVVTKKATCESNGEQITECKGCGDVKETKKLNKLSHNYKSKITKKADYKSAGITTFTCENCKDSYTESIEKLSVLTLMELFNKGQDKWVGSINDIKKGLDAYSSGKDLSGSNYVNNAINDLKLADALYWNKISEMCEGYPELSELQSEIDVLLSYLEVYVNINSVTQSNYFGIIKDFVNDASSINNQIAEVVNCFTTLKAYA